MTAADLYEASMSYRETVDRGRAEGKAEGRAEGRGELLLEVAAERFGRPPTAAAALVAAATAADVGRFGVRLFSAAGWDDLLRGD